MVKAACCEEEFVNKLLDLVKDVWEKAVPPVLGEIPSLCLSSRKVTSTTVTTGWASHCRMWWGRL